MTTESLPLRGTAVVVLGLSALVAGCRDLAVPSQSRTGSVSVTALAPRVGESALAPVPNPVLELEGLRAEGDADGNVRLLGIRQTSGTLRLTANAPGASEVYERDFDVALFGIGPQRDVSLGTVVLGRRATIAGTVLRAELSGNAGHGGIQVFVPRSPLLTTTADDGSFVLGQVPEGRQTLTAFAADHQPASLSLDVRAAEERHLAPLQLQPGASAMGALTGRVLSVEGAPVEGVVATLTQAGATHAAKVDHEHFTFEGVATGLVSVRLAAPGFISLRLDNLFFSGATTDLGTLVMRPGVDGPADGAEVSDAGTTRTQAPVALMGLTSGLERVDGGVLHLPIPAVALEGDAIVLLLGRDAQFEPGPETPARSSEWTYLGSQRATFDGFEQRVEVAWRRAGPNERLQASTYAFATAGLGRLTWMLLVLRHAAPPVLINASTYNLDVEHNCVVDPVSRLRDDALVYGLWVNDPTSRCAGGFADGGAEYTRYATDGQLFACFFEPGNTAAPAPMPFDCEYGTSASAFQLRIGSQ